MKTEPRAGNNNGDNLSVGMKPLDMVDNLQGRTEAARYKRAVLGQIFLKLISDAFKAKYGDMTARVDTDNARPGIGRGTYGRAAAQIRPVLVEWPTSDEQQQLCLEP